VLIGCFLRIYSKATLIISTNTSTKNRFIMITFKWGYAYPKDKT
jgi:hypothetical protein